VLVECMICFDNLKESSSSSQLAPLAPQASNTKKMKGACVERFYHFDTLGY
jgi:hypothetical protein